MSMTYTLTGRTSYRVETRLFRKQLVVLQVEVRAKGYEYGPYGHVTEVDQLYWQDATVEDITARSKE